MKRMDVFFVGLISGCIFIGLTLVLVERIIPNPVNRC